MEHNFAEVPRADIPRSSFNRSHGLKTTFDADFLVPILVDDIIPGDTFNVDVHHFARVGSPLINPLMDNLYLETFFFFVPYRLVWDNWEKFMGAQENPSDSIDYTIPALGTAPQDLTPLSLETLLTDYMGLPHRTVDLSDVSSLPFRAYNLIWDEWFRDQNLQDSSPNPTDDGPDDLSVFDLRKRGKRHDYFTSCLPWPQKGDAVSLPLGQNVPVFADGASPDLITVLDDGGVERMMNSSQATVTITASPTGSSAPLTADLSQATAATINDLRLAFQTQRLLERDARSGTRYVEQIAAHFGVTVPDFRLQRPEFLGGGSSVISANPVANTSDTTGRAQASLAAYGTSSGTHGFTKSFVEHGVLIGLANVRGDITYSQGIERMWFKKTRFEYYYPVLAQIGEQAVLNKEIYYSNASPTDENVFGYQERYAEYRYKPSRLTGLFRPDNALSLDNWHLSEDFAALPTLGSSFIQSNTGAPMDRALAIPSEPHIIADFYFDMKCARPMPLYGVPGNLDHF